MKTWNRPALRVRVRIIKLSSFWRYGEIRADLERRGQPIGSFDTLIATYALALDAILVTNDTAEFARVAGLRLENWA